MFSSSRDDALKKGVAGLRTLRGGFEESATAVAKETDGSDPPSRSESLCTDDSPGPSSSVAYDFGEVCVSVPLT